MPHPSKSVAEYILFLAREAGTAITPMQLLKHVYLCHGWTLGLRRQPLLEDSVEAWQYGPVVPWVYHKYKTFKSSPITDTPLQAPSCFSPDESTIMKQVWEGYRKFNGIQLSSITHANGSPWDVTVKTAGLGATISNDIIEDYYRQLSSKS